MCIPTDRTWRGIQDGARFLDLQLQKVVQDERKRKPGRPCIERFVKRP